MRIPIRRTQIVIEERHVEAGQAAADPLRRMATIAIVANPCAGRFVDDLAPMIAASADIGRHMAAMMITAFGQHQIQSYGKGGIVGVAGEQEHANAMLTTAFANPFRDVLAGADAWISSFTKVGVPGTPIDIPMNHRGDVYVRSHYDGMSIVIPDAPQADEIALIFCVANRGRLNARVGGLTHEEVTARSKQKL